MDAYVLQNTVFDRELMEESTECLECLPLCTKTRFRVFSSHAPLNRKSLEQSKSSLLLVISLLYTLKKGHTDFPNFICMNLSL